MAIQPLNDPSHLGPFLYSNGRVQQPWLTWFNQLKGTGDQVSDNAAAIAALQTAVETLETNVTSLTIRVTAVEVAQKQDAANITTLQTDVAANSLQISKNVIELGNHEIRIEALESYHGTFAVRIVNANYQVVYTDYTIDCDASGGALTITLPLPANLVLGEFHVVSKFDASLNTVTVNGNGKTFESAGGPTSVVLLGTGWSIDIQWNGSFWKIH